MNTKIGCLIIHGFAGNLEEIEPLNTALIEQGFITSCPILSGHMTTKSDMASANYSQWLQDGENAFLELKKSCHQIFVIGFSMGGLVGVHIASEHKIAGLVTLNAPIYHWDLKIVTKNIFKDMKNSNLNHIKRYINAGINIPLPSMLNFKMLVAKVKGELPNIKCPILIAQGLDDDTVHKKSAAYILTHIGSSYKQLIHYDSSNHLICHSQDFSDLRDDILKFINELRI